MRAVDTDILVCYLTNDDPDQAARARHLLAREEVFVPLTMLLEAEWVRTHCTWRRRVRMMGLCRSTKRWHGRRARRGHRS
jgi:predicted nucleic-acid-binding protein